MKAAYIGAMGWSYGQWSGKLYPDTLKPEEYLREYSHYFNSVEINNTFYRIPSVKTVENWREQTPENFIFTAKFPRSITHGKTLGGDPEKLEVFLQNIRHLENKLGPILLQFPPTLKQSIDNLTNLLAKLPEEHRYALEFRHKSWYTSDIYDVLKEYNVALVLVDHPWLPELDEITADFTYIRWQGDRNKVTGEEGIVEVDRVEDTRSWARNVSVFLESVDVYGYFSKHYSGYPPEDIEYLMSLV